jgi:Ca2+-binding EF-hand superfamily protein
MGISASAAAIIQESHVQSIMQRYGLSERQVAKLHQVFLSGDKSASDHLSSKDFTEMFDETVDSPFLLHLFVFQDVNHDSILSFIEFLSLICEFCCYNEVAMCRFAFESFDKDRSGSINENEIKHFITSNMDNRSKNNTNKFSDANESMPAAAKRAMQLFDSNGDKLLDFEEFQELTLRFPHFMWPCFRLQFRIQEKTLGLAVWKRLQKKIKQRQRGMSFRQGERPLCKFCFCLPRKVLKVKSSHVASSKPLGSKNASANPSKNNANHLNNHENNVNPHNQQHNITSTSIQLSRQQTRAARRGSIAGNSNKSVNTLNAAHSRHGSMANLSRLNSNNVINPTAVTSMKLITHSSGIVSDNYVAEELTPTQRNQVHNVAGNDESGSGRLKQGGAHHRTKSHVERRSHRRMKSQAAPSEHNESGNSVQTIPNLKKARSQSPVNAAGAAAETHQLPGSIRPNTLHRGSIPVQVETYNQHHNSLQRSNTHFAPS